MIVGVLFNLLFNATLSFWGGMLISWLAIRLLDIKSPRWKLYFLTLPFIKIVFDLYFYGLPESSVILQWANPFNLPPRHQLLTVGAGLQYHAFPFLHVITRALDLDGQFLSTSLADYLFFYLGPRVGLPMMALFVLFILLTSTFKIIRRIGSYLLFQWRLSKDFDSMELLDTRQVSGRDINIYISHVHRGAPFTTRIFSSIIVFPVSAINNLTDLQIQAVISHELAHIRHFDLLTSLMIKLLGDFFWFIPLQNAIHERLEQTREILADEQAQSLGATSLDLAQALINLKECEIEETREEILSGQMVSSFLSTAYRQPNSKIKQRIMNLTKSEEEKQGRWERLPVLARWTLGIWASATILLSIFLGNHPLVG